MGSGGGSRFVPGRLRPTGMVSGRRVSPPSGMSGFAGRWIETAAIVCSPYATTFLGETRILNLQVANAEVDLLLTRHDRDVAVKVLRREGDVEIMVLM